MKGNIPLIFHFILCVLCLATCDKLLAVTTLVRHGERLGSYGGYDPTDPYLDLRMENPTDELLNLGVEELYNVGLWMRHHYSNFLPQQYKTEDIYVQSIDFDRCLMSAEALLAALYPPVGDEIWNNNLPWQPVPIHTMPDNLDILLQWTSCPYYTIQSQKALELEKKIKNEDKGLFKFISKNIESPFHLKKSLLLYNILEGEKKINLTLPLWTHGIIPDLKQMVEVDFIIQTMDRRLRIIRAGPLVHRLLSQFERALSGKDFGTLTTSYRKMMLYSTPDMTVYFLADSLDVENFGIVNYGFSMYFELWQADNGTNFVDIFFRNSTDVNAPSHYTNIRGFGRPISFDDFKKVAGRVSVNITEWTSYCKSLLKNNGSSN